MGLLKIVGLLNVVISHQVGGNLCQSVAHLIKGVIGQSHPSKLWTTGQEQHTVLNPNAWWCILWLFYIKGVFDYLGYGPDDPPVLPRQTWGSHSHFGLLSTTFSVHIGATFLSICSSRKDDISHWCTEIAMMTWKVTGQGIETGGRKDDTHSSGVYWQNSYFKQKISPRVGVLTFVKILTFVSPLGLKFLIGV